MTQEPARTATPAEPDTARATLRLPDFLVIGAMKASTTAFVDLLARRPGVWFSAEKEPHYFTAPDYGEPAALARYADLFAAAPDGALAGEASTGYSKLPHLGQTPQRIRETLGAPPLVYLLRDPVERMVSNFGHSRLVGAYAEGTTFRDALDDDPIVAAASRYAQQIRAYHDEFGEDLLLLVTTDELHADPAGTMRRVERHLGLAPWDGWPNELPRANSQGDLAGSLTARRFAPGPLGAALKRIVPTAVVRGVKRRLSTKAPKVTATAEEIAYAQSLIEDDLAELTELLGERIAAWPSVRRLREPQGGA